MASNPDKYSCPNICPIPGKVVEPERTYAEAGSHRNLSETYAAPYVPGTIEPWVPKVYPPGAPPLYLPQPTDSTSGDTLTMGPIGPWAPGHLDWSPIAGSTGVRPVVDKYSITRYSTGLWRKNNERTLTPRATDKARNMDEQGRKQIAKAFVDINEKQQHSNKMLKKRIHDLKDWQVQVEKAQKAIDEEILALDSDRARLKSASRILMMPEAIAKECLELRTHRYEPDLIRDDAEQELIKELAIVGEIRRVFEVTLAKVEEQMARNKAAKASIEFDWSDKMISLTQDKRNLSLNPDSTMIRSHPGVDRWPENATSLEYWEHFCRESLRNCEEVRQKSEDLRGDLSSIILKGGQDMKTQADRSNSALSESNKITEELCKKLEETLKDNLQKIADIERYINFLEDSLRQLDQKGKTAMTRLYSRNYKRPNVENCRDEAQYAIMAEFKFVKESIESFKHKKREAEAVRSELMKYRGDLEKDIACKRKSLLINQDRCSRVRAHMPTPEEFAAG